MQRGEAQVSGLAAARPDDRLYPRDRDFHYRFGIDLFIAGVQAMAARPGQG